MRVFLIILACLAAAAGYLWLHMRYALMAIPVLHDMPFIIFNASLPIFVLLLLIGAAALWKRTRHVGALLQLLACCITFALAALEEIGRFLDHPDTSQLSEFMRLPGPRLFEQITVLLCFIAFLVGYIWHARAPKSI
jgi:phosphoglycerol transferase MdoB-like AlkP superfamily enzyme